MTSEPGSPEAVLLRSATPADDRPIAELGDATWRRAYAGLMPDDVIARLDVESRIASRVRRRAEPRSGHRTFVAERAGRVLGYTSCGPTRDEGGDPRADGEVYSLYVHPDAWRGGLGSRLFARAVRDLTERGFQTLRLWVLTENLPSRRFYEHHGLRLDLEREDKLLFGARLAHARYVRELA